MAFSATWLSLTVLNIWPNGFHLFGLPVSTFRPCLFAIVRVYATLKFIINSVSRVGVVVDDVGRRDVDLFRLGRSWFCKELRFLLL